VTRLSVLLVGLAMSAAALPASATTVGGEGGFSCGVEAFSSDGRVWTAVFTGGPYVVRPDESVSIRCRLQLALGHEQVAEAFVPPSPAVAVLGPQTVTFFTGGQGGFAADGLNGPAFELCTDIVIYEPGHPPRVVPEDADGNPYNGYQCPGVPKYGDEVGGVRVDVKDEYLMGPPCVRVAVDNAPPYSVNCDTLSAVTLRVPDGVVPR
jgi:hypothetical protein